MREQRAKDLALEVKSWARKREQGSRRRRERGDDGPIVKPYNEQKSVWEGERERNRKDRWWNGGKTKKRGENHDVEDIKKGSCSRINTHPRKIRNRLSPKTRVSAVLKRMRKKKREKTPQEP